MLKIIFIIYDEIIKLII